MAYLYDIPASGFGLKTYLGEAKGLTMLKDYKTKIAKYGLTLKGLSIFAVFKQPHISND